MSGYPPITMTEVGASQPIIVAMPVNANWQARPCYALGLICTLSSGGNLTYSVQVTADQTPNDDSHWNNHDILVNQTTSLNDSIAYPVTGLRLLVSAYTSGSVTLGVAQWP